MNDNDPVQPQPCGAKTRNGTPCKNLPVTGKKRCRMHGGAYGSGAPPGNSNALKHGLYSKQNKKIRKEAYILTRVLNNLAQELI